MIQPGDRVRITGQLETFYAYDSREGTVIDHVDDGYWIIQLDRPAMRKHDGETCTSVVEHASSFVRLDRVQ